MQTCAICGKQKEEKMNVLPIFKTVNVGNSEVHIDGQMFVCSDCWHKCPKCNKPIKTDEIQKVFENEHYESILLCECSSKTFCKDYSNSSAITNFIGFIKNINYREGIYRIFVLLALYCFCYYSLIVNPIFQSSYYIEDFVFISMCSVVIYLSYFIFDWVLSGFIGEDKNKSGLKGFILKIINKIKECNYAKTFYILLLITSFLFLLNIKVYYELKKTQTDYMHYKYLYENNSLDLQPLSENQYSY